MMKEKNDYIISGGEEGKQRLSILADVLKDHTKFLLEAGGTLSGKTFLDLGCGGGHVALMVAGMVGGNGHVTAVDFDEKIIALAREDAKEAGVKNVTFHAGSAYDITFHQEFDLIYARFLLSHLAQPAHALQHMLKSAKPGGRIIVEDVQFSGHFCYPACKAFDDYLHYYTAAAVANHQNPETGPALIELFHQAGIEQVQFDVIQPCFTNGPGKWMAYITMDKIKDKVIAQGLTDQQTIDHLLEELKAFTENEHTIISLPRIFRVWGIKPLR